MAPTPYAATGKLSMIYVVNTLTHRLEVPVDLDLVGGVYLIHNREFGGSNFNGQQGVDYLWAICSAFFPNTVLTPGYVLYRRVGTTFVPVESGTGTGGPGTNGGGVNLGTQLTFTFKDDSERRQNVELFETSYAAPGKSLVNTTPAPFSALINSMTVATLSTEWHDWVASRGDGVPTRFLRWTNTLNRVTRKRRGLA